MAVRPGRAGVVGGSVAGLLAAGALRRCGWDVTVHERTGGALQDRGAGVILPVEAHERLVDGGWLGDDTGAVAITRRAWLVADGTDPLGRACHEHPLLGRTNNWGVLWRSLLSRLPDLDHRSATPVRAVRPGTPPTLVTDDGEDRPDLVVGADGYRSATRDALGAGERPRFSGYVLWRGVYDVGLAPAAARELLEDGVLASPVHPGGHAVIYLVPGHEPGTRRVNWALYGRLPDVVAPYRPDRAPIDPDVVAPDSSDPAPIDPGALPHGALDETFGTELERVLDQVPPVWAEVMRIAPEGGRLVQPIYDHVPSGYAAPGVLLAGDAAAVARPHTGSGVAKAAGDAFALRRVLAEQDDLAGALATYDAERRPAGAELVELGRRLGRGMVERAPDWATAGPDAMRAWARSTLAGDTSYMFTAG